MPTSGLNSQITDPDRDICSIKQIQIQSFHYILTLFIPSVSLYLLFPYWFCFNFSFHSLFAKGNWHLNLYSYTDSIWFYIPNESSSSALVDWQTLVDCYHDQGSAMKLKIILVDILDFFHWLLIFLPPLVCSVDVSCYIRSLHFVTYYTSLPRGKGVSLSKWSHPMFLPFFSSSVLWDFFSFLYGGCKVGWGLVVCMQHIKTI